MTATGNLLPPIRKAPEGARVKLQRKLKGDLDNIVLKALRKEPERRYTSVQQLADDVERHLQGLPVTATPDSLYYRVSKFVRRHKAGVMAAALLAIAVLAGVAATVREARIAASNERRAEKRFNDVRRLANSLMFEIHDSIKDLPGSTSARRLLVTRALEYLDDLSLQSQGDISLQRELASAYERVGDVLGYPYGANLGDSAGALQSYRKTLAIRQSLAAADANANDVQLQHDLAGVYFRIAHVLESDGDFQGALDAFREALPITSKMFASNKTSALADQLAGNYYFTAGLLVQTGDPTGALENYQRGAAIRQAGLDADPKDMALRTHLAADDAGIAELLAQRGEASQAVQTQTKAIAILQELSQANPGNATLREYLGEAIGRLAFFRIKENNPTDALGTYRKAHQIFQNLVTADPKNVLAKANFALTNNGIARSLVAMAKVDAAIKIFHETASTFEEMSPRTADNRYLRSGLADTYSGLGCAYSARAAGENGVPRQQHQDWLQARSHCTKSLALWKQKEKLGELESGERNESQLATQCIARCDSQLGISRVGPK